MIDQFIYSFQFRHDKYISLNFHYQFFSTFSWSASGLQITELLQTSYIECQNMILLNMILFIGVFG